MSITSPVSVLFDVSGSALGTPSNPVHITSTSEFSTTGSLTINIASLANNGHVASAVVSNSGSYFSDVLFFVKVKTAAASTSATGYVNIWGFSGMSGQTTFAEALTGSGGVFTATVPPNLQMLAQVTANANSTTYYAGPFSFCATYGLKKLPAQWGLTLENKTAATLNSIDGNHEITWQGIF